MELLSSNPTDLSIFQGKVRVRVCGLLSEQGTLLLIKHDSIGPQGYLWAPPGGGVSFGSSAEETLKKEFLEETNLIVEVHEFLFINEYIDTKHHAIELFYRVSKKSGNLKLGSDPELSTNQQILTAIRFIPFDEIDKMDKKTLHNIFAVVKHAEKVFSLKGLISHNVL